MPFLRWAAGFFLLVGVIAIAILGLPRTWAPSLVFGASVTLWIISSTAFKVLLALKGEVWRPLLVAGTLGWVVMVSLALASSAPPDQVPVFAWHELLFGLLFVFSWPIFDVVAEVVAAVTGPKGPA